MRLSYRERTEKAKQEEARSVMHSRSVEAAGNIIERLAAHQPLPYELRIDPPPAGVNPEAYIDTVGSSAARILGGMSIKEVVFYNPVASIERNTVDRKINYFKSDSDLLIVFDRGV